MNKTRCRVGIFCIATLVCKGSLFAATWNTDVDPSSWNVDANWTAPAIFPNGVGATAIFGNVITSPTEIDLNQAITVGVMSFDNTNSYDIEDAQLTLDNGGSNASITVTTGNHIIVAPVQLNSTVDIQVNGNIFRLDGALTGSGGINMSGTTGKLFIEGTDSNTFTGLTTITSGTLVLNKVVGNVALSDLLINGAGAVVQLPRSTLIRSLTFNSGTLTPLGNALTLSSTGTALTMRGGTTIDAQVNFNSSSGATIAFDASVAGVATIQNNNIHIGGGNYTFNIASGVGTGMTLLTEIVEDASSSITKTGGGTLLFAAPSSNQYTGPTTISAGTLALNSGGTAVFGTIFVNGGTLELDALNQIDTASPMTIAGGTFNMNGNAASIDSLTFNSGTLTQTGGDKLTLLNTGTALTMRNTSITGAVDTNGDLVFDATSGGTATISGPININPSGGAATRTFTIGGTTNGMTISSVISSTSMTNFTKQGTGTLTFTGAAANTYTGGITTIGAGTLALNKTVGPAVTGTLVTINSGAAVTIGAAANQFNPAANVTIDGTLTLNGNNQTLGSTPGASTGAIHLGAAQLTTGSTAGFTFAGNIDGAGGSLFINAGTGDKSYALTGTNSYTGTTTLSTALPVSIISLTGSSSSLPGNIIDGTAAGTGEVIFDQSFSGTYPGNITGTGTLEKKGSGTLTMTGGASSIAGTTTITAGRLNVNGSLTSAGGMTVNSILGGTGTVGGNVTINGTVSPGNSIGTLTISGNATQATGSTLEIEVSPTTSDELIVGGTYTIDAGATLVVEPSPGVYSGTVTYTIVHSGGIAGHGIFDTVTVTRPAFTATVDYTATDILLLVMGRSGFSTVVIGGNAGAAATCFDTLAAPPGSDLEMVIAELAMIPTVQGLTRAFNLLQPSQFTALALAEENATLYTNETIFHRLDQTTQTCTPPHLAEKRRAYWVAPFGAFAHQRRVGEQPGFETGTGGVTTGIDYQLCPKAILGGAVGYSAVDLSWKHARGDGFMQNGYAALYGSFGGKRAYVFGSAITSYNYYDASRHIVIEDTTINRKAKNHHSGYQASAHIRGGLLHTIHSAQISPFAELDYLYVHESGFNEQGAKSLDLQVERKNSDLLRGELGVEISRCFSMSRNKVSPSLALSAIREWRFRGKHYEASFEGSPCVMHVTGMNPTRTLFAGALGLTLLLPDEGRTLSFQYQGKLGENFQDNRLLAQFLFHF